MVRVDSNGHPCAQKNSGSVRHCLATSVLQLDDFGKPKILNFEKILAVLCPKMADFNFEPLNFHETIETHSNIRSNFYLFINPIMHELSSKLII